MGVEIADNRMSVDNLQELECDQVIWEVLAELESEHLVGLVTAGAVLCPDRHIDLLDEDTGV